MTEFQKVSSKFLRPWIVRGRTFAWGDRTYLMGILNVTPDSFSDGGLFSTLEAAVAQAQGLIAAGMDVLDVGGQSTRPNAESLSPNDELNRIIPVIEAIRKVSNIPLSVDTTKAIVAEAAIRAGADIINDISGATYDPEMLTAAARLKTPIILMHLRGTPETMQQLTDYDNLVGEVLSILAERVAAACSAGVAPDRIAIDPGIGFAKTGSQNIEILRQLEVFKSLGHPVLVGPSRKSFLGKILNQPDPKERVWGTSAACCAAIAGGADLLRVHDGEMYDVCRVADAIWRRKEAKVLC
jgi:dihydropteroate synthase